MTEIKKLLSDKDDYERMRIVESIKIVDANIIAYNILENGYIPRPDKLQFNGVTKFRLLLFINSV